MELLEFREKIELPNNWEWTTIDQILDSIESGGRPKGGVKGILEGVPSIGGEHLQYSGGFDFSNIRYIPIEFFKKLSKGKIKYSDVLVVKDGATTGKTSFVSESFPFINAAVNEHVFILRPDKNKVKPKFLFFWMQSQFGQNCVAANFKGTAQGGITTDFTKNSPFPLVPINDQINIISKIEELFSQLDATEAALKRAKNNLKRYKQALLKAAVTGELTREWREAHKNELEPASILLERIKAERRAKWEAEIRAKGKDPAKEKYQEPKDPDNNDLPGLSEGWCWVNTIDLVDVGTGATPLRSKAVYYENGNIPWITSGSLNNLFVDEADEYITDLALCETNVKMFPKGSLLIALYGEGKTRGKVSELNIDSSTNQAVAALVFSDNAKPTKEYLKIFFRYNYDNIRRLSAGGVQPNLNLSIIKNTKIPLPSIKEQREIIIEVENKEIIFIEIDQTLQKGLLRIKSMRNIILHQAFSGKLIQPQTEETE